MKSFQEFLKPNLLRFQLRQELEQSTLTFVLVVKVFLIFHVNFNFQPPSGWWKQQRIQRLLLNFSLEDLCPSCSPNKYLWTRHEISKTLSLELQVNFLSVRWRFRRVQPPCLHNPQMVPDLASLSRWFLKELVLKEEEKTRSYLLEL